MRLLKYFNHFVFESLRKARYKETSTLYLSDSTISGAGKGLFAKKEFKKGDIIDYFEGELLTYEEADFLEKTNSIERGAYLIDREATYEAIWDKKIKLDKPCLDVYNSECMAKWANDAEGFTSTGKKNNASLSITKLSKRCFIYALKKIRKDEEIFISYGDDYWIEMKKKWSET